MDPPACSNRPQKSGLSAIRNRIAKIRSPRDRIELERFIENVAEQADAEHDEAPLNDALILDEAPDHCDGREADAVDRPFGALVERLGRLAAAAQRLLAEHEDDEARDHADAGQAEAVAPADRLAEIADQDGADRGAEVNAHVEDGVGAVAANVGHAVQLADHHRDVGLQETRADDDQRQRKPEDVERRVGLTTIALDRHCKVAEREQHAAVKHRLALPQITVGEVPAEHRRDVNQAGVGAVDDVRIAVRNSQCLVR
jgi:hypothetical protein